MNLTFFPQFMTIVVFSLFCLCTFKACIANNINPDQTAPEVAVLSWLIVFASMIKFAWSAADVLSREYFLDKNSGSIRV